MSTSWRRGLRRASTLVAGVTATVLMSAGAALAFPSGGNPGVTGPNHIEWTGQGNVSPSGSGDCLNEPNGQPNNTPFIFWVMTTDGGSVNTTDHVNNQPLPTITLGGTGNGTFNFDSSSQSNSVHFITPFFNLTGLTASAHFNALSTGNGSWNLVISHGCAPPTAAAPPTVTKDAAGAYQTTFAWTIKKSVDQNRINAPPGADAKFTYTVVVTHDQGTNNHIVVSGAIHVNNPDSANIVVGNVLDQLSDNVNCTFSAPAQLVPGDNKIPYSCSLPDGTPITGLTNTATVSWGDQTLGNGEHLAAGQANFTTPTIQFVQTGTTDNCVSVDDSVAGHLGNVCSTDPSPQTFTYTQNYNQDPAGTCTKHDNTATITDVASQANLGSDHQEVQVCVGADLTVKKDATPAFNLAYTWNIQKSVDNSKLVVPAGTQGTFNYQVTVSHDQGTASGWQVTGTIHVTNPNDWESVALTGVTDAIDNGGSCKITSGNPTGTIAAGATADLGYQCDYAGPPTPSNFTNTATASWDKNAASTTDGSAQGVAGGDFASVTPKVIDGSIDVTDSLAGHLGTVSVTDPNPTVFNYPLSFTAPQGACEQHDNTAKFTTSDTGTTGSASQSVQVCGGLDLIVAKSANPSFNRKFTWGINKGVDNPAIDNTGPATFNYTVAVTHDNGTDSGWKVTGAILVKNPNGFEDVPLTSLTDIPGDNGNCVLDHPSDATAIVPAGGSTVADYTCLYTSAPVPVPAVNTAVATWNQNTAGTADGSAAGIAPFDFSKTAPAITDGSVDVVDTLGGHLGTVSYTDPSPKLFTYPVTFSNDPGGTCTPHHNVATFTTSDTGTTGSASQDVLHCIGLDLQVSKTAAASFDRTYLWKIAKAADRTHIIDGGKVVYTITVNQTGVQDGNYQVKGTITVANPNDWEGFQLTDLTDTVDNGGTCTIAEPVAVTIAPSSSATFHYTCTYSGVPSNLNGHNTAKAIWTPGSISPDHSATGGADFAFTSPTNLINKVIHVTDPQAPSNPLGTLTGTDPPAAPASGTFMYTKTFGTPPSGCQTINNTATITETGQNASASVQNCTLGALTMGFWHNQNGQAIIKGSSTVGNWLRQFAPFQDLPVNATGAQVAAYDLTVFNAATCGGTTCNAMLKAQMLATALDVYFSDPALGGNKIGAPAPIGSASLNISAWSAAFGGATTMTVQQMLVYAASQSNVGGSVWYGQNKSLQVLAESAFDAVNNNTATS